MEQCEDIRIHFYLKKAKSKKYQTVVTLPLAHIHAHALSWLATARHFNKRWRGFTGLMGPNVDKTYELTIEDKKKKKQKLKILEFYTMKKKR